jgi:hypothetical protein
VLRNIVSDADKLEAIGETGLIRSYKYQTETYPDLPMDRVNTFTIILYILGGFLVFFSKIRIRIRIRINFYTAIHKSTYNK